MQPRVKCDKYMVIQLWGTSVGPDSKVSIPNDDPLDEAITDLNVLVEVTLSKKPSAYSTINFLNFKILTTCTTRI